MNFWVFPNVVLESTDDLSDKFTNKRPLWIVDKSVWYERFAKTVLVRAREGRTRFWLTDMRFRNTSESDSDQDVENGLLPRENFEQSRLLISGLSCL